LVDLDRVRASDRDALQFIASPLTRPLMGGRRSPGDSCPHPTSRRDQRTLSRIVSTRAA
jgi:hypothetical protein